MSLSWVNWHTVLTCAEKKSGGSDQAELNRGFSCSDWSKPEFLLAHVEMHAHGMSWNTIVIGSLLILGYENSEHFPQIFRVYSYTPGDE